jgi:hypothetical protein
MRSQNFMEFMRFLPGGLNPSKIETRFKSDVASKFYNSKYGEIWKLDQKGELFYLNLYISKQRLENF